MSKKEIASLIGLTERALFKTTKGDFSVLVSEHLLLLKGLFQHGLAVFDQNRKALTQWFKTPLAELATPQTGYLPTSPAAPPQSLAEISTKTGPYDLVAASNQRRQQPSLTDRHSYPTPFSLLNTSTGIQLVDDVFTRIEAGVYS